MKDIREVSLVGLIELMVANKENQEIVNEIAKEITYRMYIPFGEKTFEEMLIENGYRVIEKGNKKEL